MPAPPIGFEGDESGSVTWIDPAFLVEECADSQCALCLGVMVKPVSGCPEGHSFCKPCYGEALVHDDRCPTCRWAPVQKENLVTSRTADNFIAKLAIRCEHAPKDNAEDAGPLKAKRAKLAPLTVQTLKNELTQRGLDSEGGKPDLVARLEEDRKKGCAWTGRVGGLAKHRGVCEWEPVKCPYTGCTDPPIRRGRAAALAEHKKTCGIRQVLCKCGKKTTRSLLAGHQALCPHADINCPNEGCSFKYPRWCMNHHISVCKHERVTCPCQGCDERLLRGGLDLHLQVSHTSSAAELLQSIATLEAAIESEQRHAAASPTSWVFNWQADGWGSDNTSYSMEHDFGRGFKGVCSFHSYDDFGPCFIDFNFTSDGECRVQAFFCLLDKHDKPLREGSGWEFFQPLSEGHTAYAVFLPTAEEETQSVRANGSIRLRAVVKIFMD